MDQIINEQEIDSNIKLKISRVKASRKFYAKVKDQEDFKIANRQRQTDNYNNNEKYKQQKKDYYQANKALVNARSKYSMYKRKGTLDKFPVEQKKYYDVLLGKDREKYQINIDIEVEIYNEENELNIWEGEDNDNSHIVG